MVRSFIFFNNYNKFVEVTWVLFPTLDRSYPSLPAEFGTFFRTLFLQCSILQNISEKFVTQYLILDL